MLMEQHSANTINHGRLPAAAQLSLSALRKLSNSSSGNFFASGSMALCVVNFPSVRNRNE
jgi:hypothetical protein